MAGLKSKPKWPPRLRKRAIKKFKPNYTWLEAYEEAIILRDIATFDRPVTAKELNLAFPMRYGPRLNTVLKRMSTKENWDGPKTLDRHRVGRIGTAFAYTLTEREKVRREIAA